jgi:hypothetical protein
MSSKLSLASLIFSKATIVVIAIPPWYFSIAAPFGKAVRQRSRIQANARRVGAASRMQNTSCGLDRASLAQFSQMPKFANFSR